MSEAVSALPGHHFSGLADVAEGGLRGMITLRGALSAPELAAALQQVLGVGVPPLRRMVRGATGQAVAWMSPDELLILTDYARVAEVLKALEAALAGGFFTLADVSDARALFTLRGPQARDVLAKICPVDFADFTRGDIRRTRAAQVPAALWQHEEAGFTLICFRSVAQYMGDLLNAAARPGGEVGLYR